MGIRPIWTNSKSSHRDHDLWLVEDAAEAHLATYKGRPVGSLGRMAMFSFYGNKPFTSGEGGAMTTDSPELAQEGAAPAGARDGPGAPVLLPGHGLQLPADEHRVRAAMRSARAKRIPHRPPPRDLRPVPRVARRRSRPRVPTDAEWAQPTPWLFSVLVDERRYGKSRDELTEALAADGIETRPFFIPLHTLPPFREASDRRCESLPVTEDLGARGLNLPTYTQLERKDVVAVAEAVRRSAS